ncbi:glycosyl hydrolase 115 family protein [Paenibacillus sp. M1]|uniref:Glycosyl hydrolase 115 family protein n=1 Tax=Paenibacillus haidiansis TaxID=1574488 RepID=A0ABU7VSS7_9BACL
MFRQNYIQTVPNENSQEFLFPLFHEGAVADLFVADEDFEGVRRAAADLRKDICRVTGVRPCLSGDSAGLAGHAVLIGTIGQSPLIDRLIAEGRLSAGQIKGKWESFVIQTVAEPMEGVDSALVIAGSDKRGTIFGIYDVSESIGVSPWYWWADVPQQRKEALYVIPGTYIQGEPSVKYRGIFLNDEGPSLMAWVRSNYRDFTHEFYENVYELLLRLKANFLWPAMWDNTFFEDDPLNAEVADRYGIVIGTSHHEPMHRPHGDWKKHRQGAWDYSINDKVLYDFWEEGIRRSRDYEGIITLGMRGDGDEEMGGELSFAEKIALLERIVADQRSIIAEQTGKPAAEVPQLWALYKEVQDYYDHGMRVPDDITLLWSDDNHGNLRRVPTEEERSRSGGAGIYYHLDYVGGPRSYKWINTVPVPKIWEQMNKAYEYGADRIWILNVGDLKPMEFPLEYFLRLAWNISDFSRENAREYSVWWAERQFGASQAEAVAELIGVYTKYNGRIKPELLNSAALYSLTDYREAETAITELKHAVRKAQQLYEELPEAMRDAFFQLVLYPVQGSVQVLELHLRAARSRLYAGQGRTMANVEAREARLLFEADRELTLHYNKLLAEGKWNHMMDQTHIGYTYWNQPPENVMPETGLVPEPEGAEMGVAVEGSEEVWPGAATECTLPLLDAFNRGTRYIEVFNKRTQPFEFKVEADVPWIKLSAAEGTVVRQRRIEVEIDWAAVPECDTANGEQLTVERRNRPGLTDADGKPDWEVSKGLQHFDRQDDKGRSTREWFTVGPCVVGRIAVHGPDGSEVMIKVPVYRPASSWPADFTGHVEIGGVVSIEAEHYQVMQASANGAAWERIDGYGRTLSSMAVFPVTVPSAPQPDLSCSPSLEYPVYLSSSGVAAVKLYLAPSLDFVPGGGVRIGVSLDDGPVEIADAIIHTPDGGFHEKDWELTVVYNTRTAAAALEVDHPGVHTLRIWMVDPTAVLQKIVIDFGGVKPSLLGPPESFRIGPPEAAKTPVPEGAVADAASDPFPVPGVISGPGAAGEPFDVFVRTGGLYTLELAAIVKPGDSPLLRVFSGERDLTGPLRLRHAEAEHGSLRYVAEGVPLSAGRHTLRLAAEGCRSVQQELRLALTRPDRLAVRPSLRRSLGSDLPLTAQIGLLGGTVAACRYALTVSLYAGDGDGLGRLLGSAALSGIVPRGGDEVQRVCFGDGSAPGDAAAPSMRRAYRLKLALSYDGHTREYWSNWII